MTTPKKVRSRTIREKIVRIVLYVAILALLSSAATTFWGMERTRETVLESSKRLGQVAATDSQASLIRQAEVSLLQSAQSQAQLTEERLVAIQNKVSLIADYIAPLWTTQSVLRDERAPIDPKRRMQYGNLPSMDPALKVEQFARAEQLRYLFEPICLEDDSISSIYFVTPQGMMISYDANINDDFEQLFLDGYDFRTRDWCISAMEKKHVFTSTYLDVFGRLLTTYSVPVCAPSGKVLGVLGMDILIEDINSSVVDAKVGENGYAFLIDRAGAVISSPTLKPDAQGNYQRISLRDDPEWADTVRQMLAGKSNVARLTIEGQEVFVSYAPIPATGWSLGQVLPREEVVAPAVVTYENILGMTNLVMEELSTNIRAMLLVFASVLAMVTALVLGATRVLSARLTQPIHQLIEEVGVISGGDLERRVDLHTGDELEQLGNAFNGMTDSLKTYIADLTSVTAEKERIGAELDVAAHIQASMLPCIFPPFPDRNEFDIFATMTPAKEVGGDFYDFFLVDENHLALVIADVSGKGVPAALFMVIAKTLIKDHTQTGAPVEIVFNKVNQQLCESNDEGLFVTAWMGVLELSSGHMTYVNAGHNPPLVCAGNDSFTFLKLQPGFVLAGLEGMQYEAGELTLRRGDTIYLYTDGVTEATDVQDNLYGEPRLQTVLDARKNDSLSSLLLGVKADIDAFAGEAPQFDDITMLALKYLGTPEQEAHAE